MSEHPLNMLEKPATNAGKFSNPDLTARGETRARVGLDELQTLWINTGTLCNIECLNCYIESGPKNDRLAYFPLAEANALFDEIARLGLATQEIGFTGGEPFMNPDMIAMAGAALKRGFNVLILTNAMQPMRRAKVAEGLLKLNEAFAHALTLRVSLDHYSEALHDMERGPAAFEKAVSGIDWLSQNQFKLAIAGRTCWNEGETNARAGYQSLFDARGWGLDAANANHLVLFPEMDEDAEVPEITTACWDILKVKPSDMMCATSRMAVKRKGESGISIMPCTLLPYDLPFDMGGSLAHSLSADGGAFYKGAVKLNHPHCAKFCVLGGGSCSAGG